MIDSFEPIYAALFALLSGATAASFTGDLTSGSPVVTGIGSTGTLVPGLALIDQNVPIGATILTIDSPSQITMTLPAAASANAEALSAGFNRQTSSRLLRHWGDVPASQQPALFQAQIAETSDKRTGQPNKWTLDLKIYVYCQSPTQDTPTAPTMNALLGMVRGALGADGSGPGRMQNRQTLGGLVFDTWINGRIETDEGVLGQQGVAIVPVRILQNGP